MRELMHETIGLLNQASDLIGYKSHHLNDPYKSKLKHNEKDDELIPEWDLKMRNGESDKSGTDSGVDSNDGQSYLKKISTTNLR
jgi:hypothetical protein